MNAPSFRELFGAPPQFRACAPGRVNLMGEHTDYNGGFVLPTAIAQQTEVELSPRSDEVVRVASAHVDGGSQPLQYRLGEEAPIKGWLDYVQGVTHLLLVEGHRLGGFEARLSSQVPLGSGLSSSAALVVSLLRALREAFGLSLTDVALARLGQRAECEFVGAPVGIMDPMACSLASLGVALFIDTETLQYEKVPLPASLELIVINSGIAHSNAGGEYRVRRAECERAARLLGVKQLRELSESDVPRALALPEPLGRRVRHVVTENARVLATVEALKTEKRSQLGLLLSASHASMRDDYQVSIPEIDLLVDLAKAERGVLGARLTGGGFGGCIVALAERGTAHGAASRIAARYSARTGHTPSILGR